MRFSIYKGDRPSDGARALANALDATVLRSAGSAYRGLPNNALINWGSSNSECARLWDLAAPNRRLNAPRAVSRASDKALALRQMRESGAQVVPYWAAASPEQMRAVYDYVSGGGRVYARTALRGHSGEGIQLLMHRSDPQASETVGEFPRHFLGEGGGSFGDFVSRYNSCRLFTQGIAGHRHEWRVHVFRGQPILTQLKLRREGFQDSDGYTSLVRNHHTGWVYGVGYNREDHPSIALVEAAAVRAIEALGLDFGAVDLIQKKRNNQEIVVLEVNTAPGFSEGGSALQSYCDAFRNWAAAEERGAA